MSHAINDVQDDVDTQGASKCDEVKDCGACEIHVEQEAPSNDLRDGNQC
jgi:hypothetical protein